MDSIQNGLSSLLQNYRQIQARTADSMRVLGSGKRISHPKFDPAAWRDIATHSAQAQRIQVFSENLAAAAVTTRTALSAMDATAKHLDLLAQKLASAAEAPPTPEARGKNLAEFNRILGVMDDLASPPEPGARRLLGDPASVPGAGDITIRAGDDFSFTLRHQPIHLGEGGLNLSAIDNPEEASSDEIQAAILRVETARETLAARRQGLSIDSSAISRSEVFNATVANQSSKEAERLNAPDLSREAALMQSLSIRSSVAVHGISSLNETHQQALQLLP